MKRHQPSVESLFKAIPDDAAFIIDIKDYTKLRADISVNNRTWENIPFIKKQIDFLDSLQQINGYLKDYLAQSPEILVSGHTSGKDPLQLLYYTKIESFSDFRKIIKTLEKTPGSVVTERQFQGATIFDFLFSAKKESLSVGHINGVVLISRSSVLIENSMRKILSPASLQNDPGLEELIRSAGKSALMNLYLKYQAIPLIGQQLFQPEFRSQLEFAGKFGNWLELDLIIKPDILAFNGFASSSSDLKNLQRVFENQQPQSFEMFGKIPDNTNTFCIMGISDVNKYFADYQEFQKAQHIKPLGLADSIKSKYNINLKDDIAEIFETEAGVVFAETANDSAQHIFTLLRVKDNEAADKILYKWAESFTQPEENMGNAVQEIPVDENFAAKIYTLTAANIPAALFGSLFVAEGNAYCTLSDNYLIFGKSPDALLAYVRNILSNNTLNTSLEFSEFSEYFSNQSNFFFYNKPSLSANIFNTYLKQDITARLKRGAVNNLQAFVFQFNVNDKSIYNNIFVKYAPAKSNNLPKATWESKLDGNCRVKPSLVKNHLTGETEIFAQDDQNNIYLINKLGRSLWKQHIDEPILSDIYQIDYHRNQKLQYLFNTASKIYIIDRNGKALKGFPVTLKEKATNGLAVFDYDKNREYRIFIACADKKVYMFEKDGSQGKGWNTKETEGTVIKPVQHFRFNGSDYLVFTDDKKIYIVNRKGNDRVKPEKQFTLSENNTVRLVKNTNTKATCFGITDNDGQVYLIDTKGRVNTLNLGRFPSGHFFDAIDLDGDGNSELILTSGRNVQVFSQSGKKTGEITTESPITYKPQFYEFAFNKYKIGLVTNDNGRIYLYNSNGQLYKGFPLQGNSQFSIGLLNNSENRFNLIVGRNGNLLYNYSVQ
ncbi:MAG TPA: hypothetical protein VHO72_04740 [Bacteroidales bacterium]|nr:hypothetical protein [Bacteroidales bacterium]